MTRWYIAILLYILLICLLLAFRPAMMFQADKTYRRWGLKRDKEYTVFSVLFIFPLIAFISYYISALIFLFMT